MSPENPLVSIIVRTKDRPKLLKRALQSIASQTYSPVEVVLVNDGGCDLDIEELKIVLGDISLNYIRLEKNVGRAQAGNIGIENTKGKYIGFLDDDDEFHQDHVVTLVSFLEQSDYAVAYTDSFMIYKEYDPGTYELKSDVKKEVVFSQDFNYDKLLFENYIPFMCLLFGRDPLVSSGGFDKGFDLYEDWDLLIRIGKNYPFYHIKQVTADYNQWSVDFQISQVNRDPIFLRQAYLKVLSRHIDKITPNRVHDYMSDYVSTRNLLKETRNETDLLKHMIEERDSRINRFGAELKERDTQIDILTGEVKERASQVDVLASELKDRGSQLDTLIVELRERGSQLENLYAELKEKGPKAEKLYNELRERDAQIDRLYAELKEKGPQVEKLYNELRERASQVETLSAQLKDKDSQMEILTAEVRERALQVETLTGQWKELASQMKALTAQLKDRDSQIENMSVELRERAAMGETLTRQLRERAAQMETLAADLRGRDAQLIMLNDSFKDREDLIAAMKNTRGWKILERYRKVRDRFQAAKKGTKPRHLEPSIPKAHKKIPRDTFPEKASAFSRGHNFSMLSFDVAGKPIPSKVSVIIPTKDAGDEFDYTLRRISQQEGIGEIELVIIDSGSKDNTISFCNYYTRNIFHVPPEEFHHAFTRNLGAEKATGEFLVFTVQDAIPIGTQWLYKLLLPIYEGKAAAVSARQIPRADADLFASWGMWVHTNYMGYDKDRTTSNAVLGSFDRLDMQGKRAAASLDSVCLGIKKPTFDAYRFRAGYAEDFDLGLRLLKDNHTLLFQSNNAIIHSHNRPAMYFLKRGYVDTVSLWDLLRNERKNVPVEPVLETISYLYAVVKGCMPALKVECELGKDPVFLVHSFLGNFGKKMNGFNPSWQPANGDPHLDDFFKGITPRNHQHIASGMYSGLKDSLTSFSRYVECLQTVDDRKEDFLQSIYKLFASTAGYYLGANTQADIDSLNKGI
jgi:glycosyltransferase involved in cell wall biosynthesis